MLAAVGQENVITPVSYSLFNDNLLSINGSSLGGHCVAIMNDTERNVSTCTDTTSSVLFDGHIPALTGDMWASQLLTLQAKIGTRIGSENINITFAFSSSMFIQRVELVLLNCPQLGASVSSIAIFDGPNSNVTV